MEAFCSSVLRSSSSPFPLTRPLLSLPVPLPGPPKCICISLEFVVFSSAPFLSPFVITCTSTSALLSYTSTFSLICTSTSLSPPFPRLLITSWGKESPRCTTTFNHINFSHTVRHWICSPVASVGLSVGYLLTVKPLTSQLTLTAWYLFTAVSCLSDELKSVVHRPFREVIEHI